MAIRNTQLRPETGSYQQLATEYLNEIRELAKAAASPEFSRLATQFSDFDQYLNSKTKLISPVEDIMEASNGTGVVNASIKNDTIQKALITAHIAASSHLLDGSKFPLSYLEAKTLSAMAQQFLRSCATKPVEYRNRITHKFHTMDTIRIIQFLRALGLVTRPSQQMYQLGIGAADGTRDVLSMHLIPHVQIFDENGVEHISFQAARQNAAETVIIDSEPQYKTHYEELNKNKSLNVIAYNNDTMEILKGLGTRMTHKRNLVSGLRIDHRMLHDVDKFLHYLASCIDDRCDLVLTIGAGDTIKDFKGRIDKFEEFFKALARSGLRPLLFKFHGTGSTAKQQKTLYFGNARASSYEILYCKLESDALARVY